MKTSELLRAQDVNRWTIVSTSRPQTLAEHAFNVAILAREFCRRHFIPDMDIPYAMLVAALTHDLDEIYTGDIPTPAKQRMRELGWDVDKLEVLKQVHLSAEMKQVLKILDLFDAVHFLHNFGVGERAFTICKSLSGECVSEIESIQNHTYRNVLNKMYSELRNE